MTEKAPIRPDKALLRTKKNSYLRTIAIATVRTDKASIRTYRTPNDRQSTNSDSKAPILIDKASLRTDEPTNKDG